MKKFVLDVFVFAVLALPAFSQQTVSCTSKHPGTLDLKLRLDEPSNLVWRYWANADEYRSNPATYKSETIVWQDTHQGAKDSFTLDRVTGSLQRDTIYDYKLADGSNVEHIRYECKAVEKKF